MAILGVLLVHTSAWATVNMLDSKLFSIYNFINIFNKIGTTTFIFLSSFVLFYQYYPQKLTKQRFFSFYRNRLLYIILPYVIFSVVYFALTWKMEGGSFDIRAMMPVFLTELLTGKAHYHLYFVFVSVQFYLLFPLLLLFFQRWKQLAGYAFLIGAAIQWLFLVWNNFDLHVPNRGSLSLSYFSNFFLGAWAGMHFDRLKAWLTASKTRFGGRLGWIALWMLWLAFGITHTVLWFHMRHDGVLFDVLLFDAVWNVHTLLTALVFMHSAFFLNRYSTSFLTTRLRNLGVVSFGVYLLHPLVMIVYERYPVASGQAWMHHLWYAGGFFFALLVTWGTVIAVCRLIPFPGSHSVASRHSSVRSRRLRLMKSPILRIDRANMGLNKRA